ncbi:argininosuccinate lyase [Qipengyuania mesophila]|uniref:argininosuccinate lyase n=1 Tax=Qipengyuania mesophila TaxID=2867246 RepID=UPI003518E1BA
MTNRIWLKLCAGAALAIGATSAVIAQMYENITLVNSTGYTISEIYISPASSRSWEEDVLDWDVLEDGQEFEVDFRRSENTCDWDLKVVYDDGEEAIWDGLDLCEDWHFELFYNARTGDTHLTASH